MTTAPPVEAELPRYNVVSRKVHQYGVIALLVVSFALANTIGVWFLLAASIVMALGRFWSIFDPFRVLTTAVLQPAGILPRRMVHEDRVTRRVARVLGGGVFGLSLVLLLLLPAWSILAWTLTAAVGVMILLDAVFDFCALCFVVHHYQRLTRVGPAPVSTG